MKKFSKKLLALLLASAMTLSLAACGDESKGTNSGSTSESSSAAGTESTAANDSADTYTMNYALNVFPTNWSMHQYQTATDNDYMLGYLVAGFYEFDYNDTLDGYKLVPGMAVADPEDVTADYVGQYGLTEGEESRAWKLTLRDDLKWDDGTPIVAGDFVTSAELLLNPIAHNYRADSLYNGNLALVNAKSYAYAGQHAYASTMISESYGPDEYVAVADMVADENGVLTVDGKDIAVNLNNGASWGSNGLTDYYGAYPDFFQKDGVDLYTTLFEPNADADGYVKVTQEVADALMHIVANLHGAATVEDYAASAGDYAYQEWEELCWYGETYPEMAFSEVGILAPSDTELVLILEKPLKGFYLLYSLSGSTWLVKEDLYHSCEKVTDGVYTNSYCTSAETTASYGPYKLTSFQADKEYTLEKNENFYGLTEDTYQTTHVNYQYVAEASTRLEMFLSGQLDSYGLSAEDMETYATSDYTYYTTTPSTFFMALNPDMDALKSAQEALGSDFNKTILTVKEFRMALSFAMDRAAFALATSPTNNAAFGVFSDLIICNPDEGTGYRSTPEAKQVLVDFWGLSDDVGEGKLYATNDDAIASITGYNLEMAKQYFDQAYDIAIDTGLMDDNDVIQIKVGTPNATSNFYNKGYEFIVNCYTEAVKGTKLEGKLTFTLDNTLGNGFGDALRANQVDMLFGVGWSGSALDPYSLMEAYTTEQYQYNKHWDTTAEMRTINLNGVDYTASVYDWTEALLGYEITITAADGSTTTFKAGSTDGVDEERFQVLVALESAVLETYDLLPLLDDSSASLRGMQYEYYTEDYIYGVGRGGLKYYTYNYTDAEWDAFVAEQGGKLNYN